MDKTIGNTACRLDKTSTMFTAKLTKTVPVSSEAVTRDEGAMLGAGDGEVVGAALGTGEGEDVGEGEG